MRAIIKDQYTAARAYFLCVVGMLFFESVIQLPAYLLILRNRGRPFVKASRKHSQIYTIIHKTLTLPSYIPFITHHAVPGILRIAVFIFLNILWGWNSNEFSTDYKLYGWLTIANGGLSLLTAARNNLLLTAIRIPSPVLLSYHRWIGRAAVIHATIHFALNTRHDIVTEQLADAFASRRIQIGTMAWAALAVMFLTSISYVRRRWFESFYYSHFLFFVFVVGALIHATKGPEFLLPGLFLWAIDRGIRFTNNFRNVKVKEMTHYEGDVTKFTVEGVQSKKPGQMAWIQIPSVSSFNWHPFTIASAPGEDVVLAVRGLGGYTRSVQKLADDINSVPQESNFREMEIPKALKIRVDGPYGVGSIQWGIHPVTVLVAGGIGITPGIAIASHIIKRAALLDAQVNGSTSWHIHLLWVIKNTRHTSWFEDELKHLASLASNPDTQVTFDISIHVTDSGKTGPSSIAGEESYVMQEAYTYQGPGMVINGRPDLGKYFEEVRDSRKGLDAAVNVCGPRKLIDATRKAAAKASGRDGVFYVEEEVFEF